MKRSSAASWHSGLHVRRPPMRKVGKDSPHGAAHLQVHCGLAGASHRAPVRVAAGGAGSEVGVVGGGSPAAHNIGIVAWNNRFQWAAARRRGGTTPGACRWRCAAMAGAANVAALTLAPFWPQVAAEGAQSSHPGGVMEGA